MKFPAQPNYGSYVDLGYTPVLEIKGETLAGDYVTVDLCPCFEGCQTSEQWMETMIAAISGEETPPFDYECGGRDGLFDQDQLFAIWNPDDHRRLIAALQSALDERLGAK
jgi:hypothetical protein